MIGLLKKPLLICQSGWKELRKTLLVIIESVEGQEQWPQRYGCLFRKRSLPFLKHLGNLWPVSWSVSIKKKENRDQGSNLDLEPGLSYPNLFLLPLHCHSDPAKFRKKISTYTSKLFFLTATSITGDPALSIIFNVVSSWTSTSFFLRLFKKVLFALS